MYSKKQTRKKSIVDNLSYFNHMVYNKSSNDGKLELEREVNLVKLIMYHGSTEIMNNPTHNGGREFSDFGLGFYVTTNIEMAKSWASRRRGKPAYVNKYMLNTEELTSLTFDLDINWLLFIAFNRGLIINEEIKAILANKYKNIDDFDVIIGPTADDRMFDTLSLFFSNSITLDHCLKALNSMDLDIQYNIKSCKGVKAISFSNHIELDDIEKDYYTNEIKEKKNIMNKKMIFIRQKYGKSGKFFDELNGDDLDE